MTSLLVLLCLLSLTQTVCAVLVLFQRWEDRDDQDKLHSAVRVVLAHLDQQRQTAQETEALIGQTWFPTQGEQRRVEQILAKQGLRRQHARTGSDPFGSSAKLAP